TASAIYVPFMCCFNLNFLLKSAARISYLHSFPTRRSSDLDRPRSRSEGGPPGAVGLPHEVAAGTVVRRRRPSAPRAVHRRRRVGGARPSDRSSAAVAGALVVRAPVPHGGRGARPCRRVGPVRAGDADVPDLDARTPSARPALRRAVPPVSARVRRAR